MSSTITAAPRQWSGWSTDRSGSRGSGAPSPTAICRDRQHRLPPSSFNQPSRWQDERSDPLAWLADAQHPPPRLQNGRARQIPGSRTWIHRFDRSLIRVFKVIQEGSASRSGRADTSASLARAAHGSRASTGVTRHCARS